LPWEDRREGCQPNMGKPITTITYMQALLLR
jgi:hypothetical protein